MIEPAPRGKSGLDEVLRLGRAGDFPAAATLCRRLLKGDNKNPQLLYLMGSTLMSMGRFVEARKYLLRAIKLRPADVGFHYDLALTYKREGRFNEADRALAKALLLKPGEPTCMALKAEMRFMSNRFEEAFELLEPAMMSDEPHVATALGLARVAPKVGRQRDAVELLKRCLSRTDLAPIVRAGVLFRLAKLHEGLGEFGDAFSTCREANGLVAARFDPELHGAMVDRLIAAWTPAQIRMLPRSNARTELPVFIVGMPRSGTSLVEQILASHPKAFGAGELEDITRLAFDLGAEAGGGVSALTNLATITPQTIGHAAGEIASRLRRLSPGAVRISDKLPTNFLHLGLIQILFPAARVIHCVRDPMDTCVSCYFHHFGGSLPFAYDLGHLGAFYTDYARLMKHWKQMLDIPILDVVYERLVADQEGESRRLIEFLGLEWDQACLRFHETKRLTITASNDEVRQPMYASSIRRHERYAGRLAPLKDALSNILTTDPSEASRPSAEE